VGCSCQNNTTFSTRDQGVGQDGWGEAAESWGGRLLRLLFVALAVS
jgi:hypothetical protein